MNHVKIRMKLLVPHIVLLLLLAAWMVVSAVSSAKIEGQLKDFYNGSYVVKNAAGAIDTALESVQLSVFRALSSNSPDITGEAISSAKNSETIIREQAALIRQNFSGDTDILSRLENVISELPPMQEHVLNLAAQNKTVEAAEYMENDMIPVIEEAQAELDLLIQSADETEQALMAKLRKTRRNAAILLISLGAAGVLFSIGVVTYLRRRALDQTTDRGQEELENG